MRKIIAGMLCALLCACTPEPESIVITHDPPETSAETTAQSTATPEPEMLPETVQAAVKAELAYVLNTNTKKFHLSDCASVRDMKEENRRDITAARAEIIADGYTPCKRCNP